MYNGQYPPIPLEAIAKCTLPYGTSLYPSLRSRSCAFSQREWALHGPLKMASILKTKSHLPSVEEHLSLSCFQMMVNELEMCPRGVKLPDTVSTTACATVGRHSDPIAKWTVIVVQITGSQAKLPVHMRRFVPHMVQKKQGIRFYPISLGGKCCTALTSLSSPQKRFMLFMFFPFTPQSGFHTVWSEVWSVTS